MSSEEEEPDTWVDEYFRSPICPRCKKDFGTAVRRMSHSCNPMWRKYEGATQDAGKLLVELRELYTQMRSDDE